MKPLLQFKQTSPTIEPQSPTKQLALQKLLTKLLTLQNDSLVLPSFHNQNQNRQEPSHHTLRPSSSQSLLRLDDLSPALGGRLVQRSRRPRSAKRRLAARKSAIRKAESEATAPPGHEPRLLLKKTVTKYSCKNGSGYVSLLQVQQQTAKKTEATTTTTK